jgi:NAD(P)H dehydrogenase (quinone)
MNTILVTGATGHFGKATIEFLEKKGLSPLAMVRDQAKAGNLKNIRTGDYNNYDSLVKAFTGVDKLLFVSSNDLVNRVQQHDNVVKAAKAAGVKHIVYTSFLSTNETSTSAIALVADSHQKTEKWLKESGLPYTILKNTLYTEFIPLYIGDKVLQTGMIYHPAGEGKAAYVLRSEMAELAANILTSEGHEGKSYRITGDTAYSFSDIAKIISKASGQTVNYIAPAADDYKKTMKGYGLPEELITVVTAFAVATANGEFDSTDKTVETLLGRKPKSVETFLTEYYSKG